MRVRKDELPTQCQSCINDSSAVADRHLIKKGRGGRALTG